MISFTLSIIALITKTVLLVFSVILLVMVGVVFAYSPAAIQTLSMFALWTITVYLVRHKKCFWITLIPALFMTTVCTTFFFLSKQMLGLPEAVAYPMDIACLIVACMWFAVWYRKERMRTEPK